MKDEITAIAPLSETDMTSASLNANFTLRSEETQEIISRKPGLFEKWALLIFFFVIVIVMVCASFISYPDIVEGNVCLPVKTHLKKSFSGRAAA